MASVLLLAVGIVVASALMASAAIHFLTSAGDDLLTPTEKNCQHIANEGYRIHAMYPGSQPADLPADDYKRMMHLDNLWITECVNVLPMESVFDIANNVERDLFYGE